ncbi:hypothetical protein N7533_000944 [Penicillium manginii]|jgi:hypothetical protein|uniref:uncharacterized protein n=1 Tax=Penicillium manginii TaxID=203109 RepID=UPI0025485F1E|nr:uncharacterized protein N7533_000944 [Penicillium manginii]KAJ5768361.1 hypothetical protein N7533_000944 [Penicillium manginii]
MVEMNITSVVIGAVFGAIPVYRSGRATYEFARRKGWWMWKWLENLSWLQDGKPDLEQGIGLDAALDRHLAAGRTVMLAVTIPPSPEGEQGGRRPASILEASILEHGPDGFDLRAAVEAVANGVAEVVEAGGGGANAAAAAGGDTDGG